MLYADGSGKYSPIIGGYLIFGVGSPSGAGIGPEAPVIDAWKISIIFTKYPTARLRTLINDQYHSLAETITHVVHLVSPYSKIRGAHVEVYGASRCRGRTWMLALACIRRASFGIDPASYQQPQ